MGLQNRAGITTERREQRSWIYELRHG